VTGASLPLLESPIELAGLYLLVSELNANGFSGIGLFVGESGIIETKVGCGREDDTVDLGLELELDEVDAEVTEIAVAATLVLVNGTVAMFFFTGNGCRGTTEVKGEDLLRDGVEVTDVDVYLGIDVDEGVGEDTGGKFGGEPCASLLEAGSTIRTVGVVV